MKQTVVSRPFKTKWEHDHLFACVFVILQVDVELQKLQSTSIIIYQQPVLYASCSDTIHEGYATMIPSRLRLYSKDMSEVFPMLHDSCPKPQMKSSRKKYFSRIKLHPQCFNWRRSNIQKLKYFSLTAFLLFMVNVVPKYFTIIKRYNQNSYYLHYKQKYDRCKFDPEGPVPAILIARGRSGSSVTWDTLSRLAGDGEPTVAHEVTGGNQDKSIAYFDQIKDHINERWASLKLCNIQRYHMDKTKKEPEKTYSLVGFQWKPFQATFDHHYAFDGLRRVADDGLKVIYLTRNPLDRYISNLRHKGFIHSEEVPAHCEVDDKECVERHKKHSKGIKIPVNDQESKQKLLGTLEHSVSSDVMIEDRLKSLNVNYVHVTYEKLFDGDAKDSDKAVEWMKMLRFLGFPKKGLTYGDVRSAFHLASTSSNDHSSSIANFEEVKKVLADAKYGDLLHL